MLKKIISFARFAYGSTIEEVKQPQPVITQDFSNKSEWFAAQGNKKRRVK